MTATHTPAPAPPAAGQPQRWGRGAPDLTAGGQGSEPQADRGRQTDTDTHALTSLTKGGRKEKIATLVTEVSAPPQ